MKLLVAVLTVLLKTSSIAVEIEMPGADCACSFVDIGLNNGDTLFQWPHTVLEEAHKNGLSNASAFGEVSAKLKHCLDPSMRRKSCFYGFELSPELTPILRKLDKSIKAGKFGNGVQARIFTETAIGLRNEDVTVYAAPMSTHSSMEATKLTTKRSTRGKASTSDVGVAIAQSKFYRHYTSKSLNFVEVVNRLRASTQDFLAVKMDIEGTEYSLIPNALLHHARSMCSMDLFAIEWHGHMMPTSIPPNAHSAMEWMLKSPSCNITVVRWW
jgi:hypothetical protein